MSKGSNVTEKWTGNFVYGNGGNVRAGVFIGTHNLVPVKTSAPTFPPSLIYVAAICPAAYRCSKKRFTTCSPVSVCTFSQYTPLLSVVGISSACTPAAVRLVA
jgi:hypothetical protein